MEALRDVYVSGAGMTRFGRQPERSLKHLTAEAVEQALDDAGVGAGTVEAAYFANAIGGSMTGQEMVAGQVALRPLGIDGIAVHNVENACASASTAMHLGWQAVASGAADVVLCVGAERMSHPEKGRALVAIGGAVDVDDVFGPAGPQAGGRSYFMDLYAGQAQARLDAGTAAREDFAAVAAKNRRHGALNPRAQYGRAMTVEDVLAAREIVWPLTLPMCSPVSDGAAAVVLTAGDAAVGGPSPRVRVAASVVTSGSSSAGSDATARASRRAYERAAIGPEDLDLVECHDAAAPAEISLYESLGLAHPGEGARLIREGATELGGRLPVNTSGGLLSKGHPIGATGLAQVHETVTQLRGRAGARQVAGARWALTQNGGGWIDGDNAAVAVHILERSER